VKQASLLVAVVVGLIGGTVFHGGCAHEQSPPTNEPTPSRSAVAKQKPAGQGPKFKFSQAEYNLGRVAPGSLHQITVKVWNRGTAQLTVSREQLRGRISVDLSKFKVPPGNSRLVTFVVVAPEAPGPFSVSAGFHTNDPDQPLVLWSATGVVEKGSGSVRRHAVPPPPASGGRAGPNKGGAVAKARVTGPHPVVIIPTISLDAGVVNRGEPAHYEFKVKNIGTAAAVITAKPGCGCTVAKYDREIPPGGVGTIRARLDTTAYDGQVTKEITVTTNDPTHPVIHLTLTVDVKPHVQVLPSDRYYARLYEGESLTHEFTLYSNDREPLEITSVSDSSHKLKLELIRGHVPVKGHPNQTRPGYRLRVTIPKDLPSRGFASTITVETNNKHEPRINLTVSGVVLKEISVSPQTLYFVIRNKKERPKRVLTVTKRSGTFKITKVDVGGLPLKVRITNPRESASCRVEFTYTGGWKPGFVNGMVVLHTNNEQQPLIQVPVTASVVWGSKPSR